MGWEALRRWGENAARIEPLSFEADWCRVAGLLRRVHELTPAWPQRPGWRSSTDLLVAEVGTKIDLRLMPAEGVRRCRAAWARLVGRPTCVVHGDPNPGNIRVTADRVALIDWDDSYARRQLSQVRPV